MSGVLAERVAHLAVDELVNAVPHLAQARLVRRLTVSLKNPSQDTSAAPFLDDEADSIEGSVGPD